MLTVPAGALPALPSCSKALAPRQGEGAGREDSWNHCWERWRPCGARRGWERCCCCCRRSACSAPGSWGLPRTPAPPSLQKAGPALTATRSSSCRGRCRT